MPRQKTQTSVRMSADALTLQKLLAAQMGLTKTAVIETAIRRLAKAEGVTLSAKQ